MFFERVRIVGVSVVVDANRLVDIRDEAEERVGRDVRRVRSRGLDISNVWTSEKHLNWDLGY